MPDIDGNNGNFFKEALIKSILGFIRARKRKMRFTVSFIFNRLRERKWWQIHVSQ